MKQVEIQTDFKLLTIASKAFMAYENIPPKYTCDGENISPPLEITGVPPTAKSLALMVEDPDAVGEAWLHWMVWNIPVVRQIKENEIPGEQGLNDFGKIGYGGPCPPSGSHRYFFKVYALDCLLDLRRGAHRKEVEDAIRDHILAYGELVGLYKAPIKRKIIF